MNISLASILSILLLSSGIARSQEADSPKVAWGKIYELEMRGYLVLATPDDKKIIVANRWKAAMIHMAENDNSTQLYTPAIKFVRTHIGEERANVIIKSRKQATLTTVEK